MIKKTVCYDSSPALHIAEARLIELSSGTSLAQFLMVRLHLKRLLLFIDVLASCEALEKSQSFDTLMRSQQIRVISASRIVLNHLSHMPAMHSMIPYACLYR